MRCKVCRFPNQVCLWQLDIWNLNWKSILKINMAHCQRNSPSKLCIETQKGIQIQLFSPTLSGWNPEFLLLFVWKFLSNWQLHQSRHEFMEFIVFQLPFSTSIGLDQNMRACMKGGCFGWFHSWNKETLSYHVTCHIWCSTFGGTLSKSFFKESMSKKLKPCFRANRLNSRSSRLINTWRVKL